MTLEFTARPNILQPMLTHAHTMYSNLRLRDAINKVEDLLEYALEKGLKGVAITDHEVLSAHVKAHQYVEENRDRFGDFTLAFGNEIYLVDREEVERLKPLNERIPFHHFILIAKNQKGYDALKELSSLAWKNEFFYKGMQRVPTYKDDLERIMKENKGNIIATTACVGGQLPQLLIKHHHENSEESRAAVHELVMWLLNIFGEDLYFELQPTHTSEEQKISNEMMKIISGVYGVKKIVATDAHFLNKAQQMAHKIYLQASNGEREVEEFYSTTYVMDHQELSEYFEQDLLYEMIMNTHEIASKLKPISFEQEITVPKAHIPEFEQNQLFVPYYMEYEYLRKYSQSPEKIDRYYLHLLAEGMLNKKQELNKENLSRINTELKEIYEISEKLKQPLSSYFVLTKDLIDLMWEISLVGVSRGSAACYYTNYLLDIVQINPIQHDLPHWRFLTSSRIELPDIDIDAEGSKRLQIVNLTKERYGEENVLNMGTFITEGSRSAVLTACRGMGIDKDISQYISSLIPADKTDVWSINDCFYGNEKKNRKPAKKFIEEVEKFEGLSTAILAIDGLVSGRGQHASGIILYPNGYLKQNALMKTSSGLEITQFDAEDSTYMGALKLDFLSISALERIRTAMELLLKDGKIQWQGSLRATYNKYFHPDVLDMTSPEMFKLLVDGHVLNAFQFETSVGSQTISKIKPKTFEEICAGNSLMRLTTDGEQPLDKFIRFKNDISQWYSEMNEFGLNEDEVKTLEKHVAVTYGICDTQEVLMELSMDPKISGFNLTQANKFRKAVAKQNEKLIEAQRLIFFENGEQNGVRLNFLNYVWDKLLKPQFGYAFSSPHIKGYSMILMIEMNICYRYGEIYWKTACLTVNAGLLGEEQGGTDYGAIAKAIGAMKDLILPPSINLSEKGFVPYEEKNKILFGLKPILGLGTDALDQIIENRPFTSFEDFYERMVLGKKISEGKTITLIKSGCFDEFNPNRRMLMVDFVRKAVPKRTKLTMVQLEPMIKYIDQEKYKEEISIYNFRKLLFGRNKVQMNKEIEKEFISKYSSVVEFEFEDGFLKVNEKSFDKYYKAKVEPLKVWLNEPNTIDIFNKMKMEEYWVENCLGNKESWEMQSNLFYSDKHEMDYMPLSNYFSLAKFNELPLEPVVTEYKNYRGRQIPRYKIEVIAGTVVDKNKTKSLVSILTQDSGVVTIRIPKGSFGHYDQKVVRIEGKEKTVLDESWFNRGTHLICVGFRREGEFILRKTGSIFSHTLMRINGYNNEALNIQMEKVAN